MQTEILETVTVLLEGDVVAVINKTDFDPARHRLAPVKPTETPEPKPKKGKSAE